MPCGLMDQRISTLAECFPDSVIRVDENMVTLYTEMPPVDAQRELDRLCDEWVKCSAGSLLSC